MPVTATPKKSRPVRFPSTVAVTQETRDQLKAIQRAYRMRDGAVWTQPDVLAAIVAAEAARIASA